MAKAKSASEQGAVIRIQDIRVVSTILWLIGNSPLISNRFAKKGIDMMLASQLQLPESYLPRQPKDPWLDFCQSQHKLPDGSPAVPGGAFKSAMVAAVRQLPSAKVKMNQIKQFFHVRPHLIKIYGDKPRMIQHVVRNQTGVADIRFRSIYMRWCVGLPIDFDADLIGLEAMGILASRAGFGCGIGDWRTSAPKSFNGQAGSFHVAELGAKKKEIVDEAYTKWCVANPPDEAEMEAWGVVPDEQVAFFKELHDLGPAERKRLAAEAAKLEKDKERLAKIAEKQKGASKVGRKPRGEAVAVSDDEHELESPDPLDPVVLANGAANRNVR
jgi:hypothetical protein